MTALAESVSVDLLIHPSGPIPPDVQDYVNATLVVERLANMARVRSAEECS